MLARSSIVLEAAVGVGGAADEEATIDPLARVVGIESLF